MALEEDLRQVAEAAIGYAGPHEALVGIVPAEPGADGRAYLCAYREGDDEPHWLVLDAEARPIRNRARVREVVSIAALCELADELAAGGDLDELRTQLATLRVTEAPAGIDEAEEAAARLESTIGEEPRLATPLYLDRVGTVTRRLEQALGGGAGSPFAAAMKQATATVEELVHEVESNYKRELV